MAAQCPGLELWAAGFSFGAYVALTVGADDDRICALIGIGPPVDRYDFAAATRSAKPKFIVHGEADELIPLKRVREFYARLDDPKELVTIDRANHLFDGQAGEVGDALEELLMDFSCRTQ
jgi:alpha/beta superfamily hydrolase